MWRIYRTFFNRRARLASQFPVILMYHRVARLQYDPWDLAVDPKRFDAQMAWLASERLVLPLHNFVDRLRAGELPNDSAAITFDDGYLDNLTNALPRLHRYGLSATLFFVGEAIGSSNGFWWDELARLILGSPAKLEASLTVGQLAGRGRISCAEPILASVGEAISGTRSGLFRCLAGIPKRLQ